MRRTTAVLASAALLSASFIGYDAASYAVSGKSLVIGHNNSAHSATTLKRTTAGAALVLKTKHGSPPLQVSSSKVVKHLNASEVQGFSAKTLLGKATTFRLPPTTPSGGFSILLPHVPTGTYYISYAATLDGSSPSDVLCSIEPNNDNTYFMLDYGVTEGSFTTFATSSVRAVKHSDDLRFQCGAGTGTIDIVNNDADFVDITFTPLGSGKLVNVPSGNIGQRSSRAPAGTGGH